MKLNNKISKTRIIVCLFFLVTLNSFAQLKYGKDEQILKLRNVANSISESFYAGDSRTTVAVMQIPGFDEYIITTNGSTVSSLMFTVFKDMNGNDVNGLQLLTGFFQSEGFDVDHSNTSTVPFYFSRGEESEFGVQTLGEYRFFHMPMPARSVPQRDQITVNPSNPTATLNIHAEMTMIGCLAAYHTEFESLKYNPSDIIIVADKDYCPRCYHFLNYNGFGVPEPEEGKHVDLTNVATSITLSNWCLPQYSINKTNGNFLRLSEWPTWIGEACFTYDAGTRLEGLWMPDANELTGERMIDLDLIKAIPQDPRIAE